jgi:hypothetical protein
MHALDRHVGQFVGRIDDLAVALGGVLEAGAELELLEESVVDRLPVPLLRIDLGIGVRGDDVLDQRICRARRP